MKNVLLGQLAKVEYELSAQVKSDQTYSAKEIFQIDFSPYDMDEIIRPIQYKPY